MIGGRYLRFLCRLGSLALFVDKDMVEALACGRALFWINLQHELEQVFEHAVLLTPSIVYNIVEQEHA